MKLAIIIGVVVILFVVFILASYIKAPTDRALIVSGLRKNPKFVIGKSALRIPFLQRVDKLELKMISVDVKTKESVPTNEYINVNIDSAVKIKVGSSKEMLEKAASNFLNKNEDYIRNSVGDVLEGNVREIIGQMRLEDIVQDRKMFAEKVQENAAPDMARMGLEIVSFNVQNVTDEGNVIENLGIDRVVSISKSAQISRAESERDIEVAKANATKQANDARIEAETAIAERNNELEIKKQELKRAADVKKAEADAAYEIQQQEQRKTIEITTADANIAKPLESIDKVTIIDGGSGENGVGTFSGNVPSVLAKTIESIKETTGFDLTEVMKANTYDAKTTKNVNFTGLPEEMSAAAKEPETDGKTE